MPSFLITDILSHETQTNMSKISSEYVTDQESFSISPCVTDSSPSPSDASTFLVLNRYLSQSGTDLAQSMFPLMWTHCIENNRMDNSRTMQVDDESWKTHPLIEALYKQTCLVMRNSSGTAEGSENLVWPSITFSRSGGAFHPVRRISISDDCAPHRRTRNLAFSGQSNSRQIDNIDKIRASNSSFSLSNFEANRMTECRRSTAAYIGEHGSFTDHACGAANEKPIPLVLDDSDRGSGDDQSVAKGLCKSPYGSNSALDALIHMTASSMQRLNRKVDKPISPTDRLELCPLGRSSQLTKRRKTRTTFSNSQLSELENNFNRQKYLTPTDRDRIAKHLGLSNTQVITWFQNRRAKLKREAEELERDILAARQQEQQKLLDFHSLESKGGAASCDLERFIPEDRWNSPRVDEQTHVRGRKDEANEFGSRFSKFRVEAFSPSRWSDSSSISERLNDANNKEVGDDSDEIVTLHKTGKSTLKATTYSVTPKVNRIISTRKSSVWSPAEELELMIS